MGIDFSSRETETGTNIDEVAVMYARPSGYTISSIEADTGTTAIVRNASGAYSASAFSPDGSRVAFGYDSGLIEISNTQTGQAIQSISTTSGRVWSLAFSPDGNMLASSACLTTDLDFCTENVLYLWQLSDGTLASQLPPANLQIGQESLPQFQTDYILSLAFSPDGRVLASGSKDHTIVLWGIDTQLPLAPAPLGHAASVTSLTFTPDGSMLASGDQDGALILWDTALFQPIGTPFSGLTEGIASLAFRQDGQLLASGGSDGRIVLWDTSIDSWLTSACSLAGRNFTSDEWRLFFGDRPYQKTCPQWP
jgi:WD40 repeat protein